MSSEFVATLYSTWKASLDEGNSIDAIVAFYGQIGRLSNVDFIAFFTFSEALASLKTACTHESLPIRCTSIKEAGKLLIRLYILVHEMDIEGCYQYETQADAGRRKEDIVDFINETFKTFSNSSIGKLDPSLDVTATVAASMDSSLHLSNAYAIAISELLAVYHNAHDQLEQWVDTLCGISTSPSKAVMNKIAQTYRIRSINMSGLVQMVMSIVFDDPFLMIKRAQTFLTYQNQSVSLVNNFILCILKALPFGSSKEVVLTLATSQSKSMFAGMGNTDITANSRQGTVPINVYLFCSQWIEDCLLCLLASAFTLSERLLVIKDILLLTQHQLLTDCRKRVSRLLLEEVLFILEHYDNYADHHASISGASYEQIAYDQLLAWSLLILRDIHPIDDNAPQPALNKKYLDYLSRLLVLIKSLTLDNPPTSHIVLQGRLLADYWMIVASQMADKAVYHCCAHYEDMMALGNSKTPQFQCSLLKLILEQLTRQELLPLNRANAFTEAMVMITCQTLLLSMQQILHLLISWPLHMQLDSVGADEVDLLSANDEEEEDLPMRDKIEKVRRLIQQSPASNQEDYFDSDELHHWSVFHDVNTTYRRFQYLLEHSSPQALYDHLQFHKEAMVGITVSMIQKVMQEDYEELTEMLVSATEDAAYCLQVFAQCFKWSTSNAANALMALAQFLCDLLQVGSTAPVAASTACIATISPLDLTDDEPVVAAVSVGSFQQYLLQYSSHVDELKARKHLICLIVLSLLDNLMKTCNLATVNASISTNNQVEILKYAHVDKLLTLICIYALPYAYEFNPDLNVLLTRIHFILFYAYYQLYNIYEKQLIADKLVARASVGFLGGLQDAEEMLVMDCQDTNQQVLHQLHALEVVNILLKNFQNSFDVMKVVLPFLLDLQQNFIYNEVHSFLSVSSVIHTLQLKCQQSNLLQISTNASHGQEIESQSSSSSEKESALPLTYRLLNTFPVIKEEVLFFIHHTKIIFSQQHKDQVSIDWSSALQPDVHGCIAHWLQKQQLQSMRDSISALPEVQLLVQHVNRILTEQIASLLPMPIASASLPGSEQPSDSISLLDLLDTSDNAVSPSSNLLDDLTSSSTADFLTSVAANGSANAVKANASQHLITFYQQSKWSEYAHHTQQLGKYDQIAGLFSKATGTSKTVGIVHGIDFLAALYDVFAAHLYHGYRPLVLEQHLNHQAFEQQIASAEAALSSRSADWDEDLMGATLDYNETTFTQISGSDDLLVVLASIQHSETQEQRVRLRLKIYNNSSFKIPYFLIQVLLSADNVLGSHTDTILFSADELNMADAIGPAAALYAQNNPAMSSSNLLLGAEYLPPGAMVERELAIKLLYFAPVDVIVRIVYPDLTCDNTFLGHDEALAASEGGAQVAKGPRYAAASSQHKPSTQLLTHFDGIVPIAQASSKWDALLHCSPLRIPLSAMLQPYGAGVYCMRRRFILHAKAQKERESECSAAGIPWPVFRAQFARLGSRYAHIGAVVGYNLGARCNMLEQVLDSMQHCMSAPGGLGIHFLGTDCVSVNSQVTSPAGQLLCFDPHELPDGNSKGKGQGMAELGWSLQTLWGAEISVMLLEDKVAGIANTAQKEILQGQLHIRCSESHLLSALLLDMEAFVQALSGGYLLPAAC